MAYSRTTSSKLMRRSRSPTARRAARPGEQRVAGRGVVVHGGGVGGFARRPRGGGGVACYDRADLAAAGMAGLPPAAVIAADVSLELADTRRPHREEDRQPHPPDRGVRLLGHRRDAKRRARLLVGLGHRAHGVVLAVLALVCEPR